MEPHESAEDVALSWSGSVLRDAVLAGWTNLLSFIWPMYKVGKRGKTEVETHRYLEGPGA